MNKVIKELLFYFFVLAISFSYFAKDIVLGRISNLRFYGSPPNYIASFAPYQPQNTNRFYASQYTNIIRTFGNFGPYLLCPSTQGITNEIWTVTVWFRSTPGPNYPDDWKYVFKVNGPMGYEHIAVGSANYHNGLGLRWDGGSSWMFLQDIYEDPNKGLYQDGNWHFVAVITEQENMYLYFDGEIVLTNSLVDPENRYSSLNEGFGFSSWIDADYSPESPSVTFVPDVPMDIDQICIFTRILSTNELNLLWGNGSGLIYNASSPPFNNGLVACWDFDDFTNSLETNIVPNKVSGGPILMWSTNLGEIKQGGLPIE